MWLALEIVEYLIYTYLFADKYVAYIGDMPGFRLFGIRQPKFTVLFKSLERLMAIV